MSSAASSSSRVPLSPVSDKVDFNAGDHQILAYWKSIDAFKQQLKLTEGRPEFNFYDGPPFATGLPHYGHILAGTIKDVVTRYASQTGHHVSRRFGWDCHGLPVEYEIDKKLGISSRDDVMKMGVAAYNNECRAIVNRYTHEWESTVLRMGRWIDFQNAYKTMDLSFMECVWWVVKSLHEKGLLYRGYKVMPYSTACTTPLSNFEAGLNYKPDVIDPACVVSFPIRGDEGTSLLAWTTTPWTLPSNFALAVNPHMEYVKLKDAKSGAFYILGKLRLSELYPKKKGGGGEKKEKEKEKEEKKPAAPGAKPDRYEAKKAAKATAENAASGASAEIEMKNEHYEIVKEYKGSELVGIEYVPLFPYFAGERERVGAFRVLSAEYVTDDSGTGIVHQAPAFGEDDYQTCVAAGIVKKGEAIICPVDDSGRFTADVPDFVGRYVKEADKDIQRWIKEKGRLVKQGTIVHSYPYCWRSDTPLLYRAVPSWFVAVETFRDRLIAANESTNWVPSFVKEKRFQNWLADARDWAISRNRYWGTPLPIWVSDDGKEIKVIGSAQELRDLSGRQDINDLHKDKIDDITIPGKDGKVLRRVQEVADCWLESGSMPYGQQHYPFENKEKFESSFPAHFIGEGLDQTRGWFYTLMVLSTALFDKPPFKNVIVNGMVLAADGKKMSKRLKNYPDPLDVVTKYGADALRVYLVNSPVVRAEALLFNESGVLGVVKSVFLPWFHAYRFFVENALRYGLTYNQTFEADPAIGKKANNFMDKWIISAFQSLVEYVREEMAAYRLYTVTPRLLSFIEQLTNWYVRMNRKRLKGGFGQEDCRDALNTLHLILLNLSVLMAPFTPFFVETMYQNLKRVLPPQEQKGSIHFIDIPPYDPSLVHLSIETTVQRMQTCVELGRQARMKRNLPLSKPLKHMLIVHRDQAYLSDVRSLSQYIKEEMGVRAVDFSSEEEKFIRLKAEPNLKILGQRLNKKSSAVCKAIRELSNDQVKQLKDKGQITVLDEEIKKEDVEIVWEFQGDAKTLESQGDAEVLVVINVEEDEQLIEEEAARDVVRAVQKLRKRAGLVPTDEIEIFYSIEEGKKPQTPGASFIQIAKLLKSQGALMKETLNRNVFPAALKPSTVNELGTEEVVVGNECIRVIITPACVCFSDKALAASGYGGAVGESIKKFLGTREYAGLKKLNQMKFTLDGHAVDVKLNQHYFLSIESLSKTL